MSRAWPPRWSPSTGTRPRWSGPSRRPACSPTSTRSSSCWPAPASTTAWSSPSTRPAATSRPRSSCGGPGRLPGRPRGGGRRGLPLRPPAGGQRGPAAHDGCRAGVRGRRARPGRRRGPPGRRRNAGVVHPHPPALVEGDLARPPTPCWAGRTRSAAWWPTATSGAPSWGSRPPTCRCRATSCCPPTASTPAGSSGPTGRCTPPPSRWAAADVLRRGARQPARGPPARLRGRPLRRARQGAVRRPAAGRGGFDSVDALVDQIGRDCDEARRVLGTPEPPHGPLFGARHHPRCTGPGRRRTVRRPHGGDEPSPGWTSPSSGPRADADRPARGRPRLARHEIVLDDDHRSGWPCAARACRSCWSTGSRPRASSTPRPCRAWSPWASRSSPSTSPATAAPRACPPTATTSTAYTACWPGCSTSWASAGRCSPATRWAGGWSPSWPPSSPTGPSPWCSSTPPWATAGTGWSHLSLRPARAGGRCRRCWRPTRSRRCPGCATRPRPPSSGRLVGPTLVGHARGPGGCSGRPSR